MILFSTLTIAAIAVFIFLALLGFLFYFASQHGWLRNGYFRVPAVILIVLGLFLAFQAIGNGITLAAVGVHVENHPVAALSINGLAEILVMIGGAAAISIGSHQNLRAIFRLEGISETPATPYLLAVPMILAAQYAGEGISAIWERFWEFAPHLYHVINQYETSSDKTMQGLVTATGPLDLILILLFVAIVPALAEEAMFRGFAQTNIERSGQWHARPATALVVASLLFALVHASLFKLPGLFVLGLVLGWMTYRTNNLFVGGIGHAINNGFIVAALYFSPDTATSATSSMVGTENVTVGDAAAMLALSIPILAFLLYWFWRSTAHITARGNAEREHQQNLWQAEHPASPIQSLPGNFSQ